MVRATLGRRRAPPTGKGVVRGTRKKKRDVVQRPPPPDLWAAPLRSADVRGKDLSILGHSNFSLTKEEGDRAYLELLDHLIAGRIELPLPRFRDANQRTLAAMGEIVKRYEIPRRHWRERSR